MRPGVSRVLLTTSVLCIASNGCVRWGEQEEQEDDRGGCSSASSEPADDDYTTSPTYPPDDGMPASETQDSAGEPTPDVPDEPEWPTAWPIADDAAVVVWGKTGIPTKNLALVRNIYVSLAQRDAVDGGSSTTGSTSGGATSSGGMTGGADTESTGTGGAESEGTGGGTDSAGSDTDGTGGETEGTGGETDGPAPKPEPSGAVNILWVADCDPRTDVVGCLAGNVQPYFAMVDTIGVIDFKPLSEVDPLAYDVVVADFCGPVSATAVGEMLGEGARVLVLGDTWCVRDGQTSAAAANELLEHIGTRFGGEELYNHDYLVPEVRRVGILDGIERIDAWGVALQGVGPEFDELAGTAVGTLLSSRN